MALAWRRLTIIFLKILKYALLIVVALFILALILLSNVFYDLKSAAQNGLAGKNQLLSAASAVKAKNWDAALGAATPAAQNFNVALGNLDKARSNKLLKNFPPFANQINDLEYVLKTGEILSRSLMSALPIAQDLQSIISGAAGGDFSSLKKEDKARFLRLIYESGPEVNGLKANLDLALMNLDKIHRIGILWPAYQQLSDLRSQLQTADSLLTELIPLSQLLPGLAGYPQTANWLLILQNNSELRPTGGFIGNYGLLTTDNGEIVSLSSDDSYHVDMPAVGKWRMTPPAPLAKYLKVSEWYLRDANWSPDWLTAAQKIQEIYRGEVGAVGSSTPEFNGVIAVNPELVADLINLTGPVTISGQTYDASNFQDLLQYTVEVGYKDQNISSWDRKQVINDIMTEIKKRLFALPADRWPELLTILKRNLAAKNIQLYFKDPALADLAMGLGATGRVASPDGDYLMVVDANLAAFKTDSVVKKGIDYSVKGVNGGLTATLKLTYEHTGGFDWRTTTYRSYTRILAPLGSRLISLAGADEKTYDLSVTDDPILNKTVFAFFFTVEPGANRTLTLNYRLPDNLAAQARAGQYHLLIQKQSGRKTGSLSVFLPGAKTPIQTDLNTDKTFGWSER